MPRKRSTSSPRCHPRPEPMRYSYTKDSRATQKPQAHGSYTTMVLVLLFAICSLTPSLGFAHMPDALLGRKSRQNLLAVPGEMLDLHAGGCNDTPGEIGSRVCSFVLGH